MYSPSGNLSNRVEWLHDDGEPDSSTRAGAGGKAAAPGPGSKGPRSNLVAAARKRQRAEQARQAEIDALEKQIADCEAALREIEQTMVSPGFYENRDASQPVVERHQELMWQIGDLMHRWEKLQSAHDPGLGDTPMPSEATQKRRSCPGLMCPSI